ncbi:MAG: 4-alpha-glucanotransferase [Oscillibacter sp.]
MIERSSGILMPISSLPSPHGIGTMGKAAYDFADFLAAAGQKYWQLLPLGPTSYGDSPYQSFSSFAGNPYFIDLDLLVKDKLLTRAEVNACDWGDDPHYVDYGKIYASRFTLLEKAKTRGFTRDREAVAAFERENERWLPNYALFMALKRHFGMKSWTEWDDEDIRCRTSGEVIERYRAELREDVELFTYIQFLFFRQWEALKAYIHSLGIRIIGDLPIYVAMDSADVWAEPEMFQLDEHNVPTEVSGVPPDCFSEDGQLWGNPLYNYEAMAKDGFGWWIRRIGGAQKLYDVIRIDHFRGFESYWAIPYGETTAKNGRWVKRPRHVARRRADRLVPATSISSPRTSAILARGRAAALRFRSSRHEGPSSLRSTRATRATTCRIAAASTAFATPARTTTRPRPLAHGDG